MSTKILRSIISLIKFIVTVIVIVIVAIILVQRFSNNNMSIAGYRIFTVVTESMVPKYLVGDVLLVKETDATKINLEDDVTYMGKVGSFANKIVTHQVIGIENAEDGTLNFHTKGIANEEEDPIVNESQIFGVVQAKLAIITKLNGLINNMYGMYFLIIIPLAVIMFSEFRAFKDDEKDEEDDDDEDTDDEDADDEDDDEDDDEKDEDNYRKKDKKIEKRKEKRARRRRRYE